MKRALSVLSICLFLLLPNFVFADMPGGHSPRVSVALVVTNTDSFPKYNFYYTYGYDTILIKQQKVYKFTHGGNPNTPFNIFIYAQNKETGKKTARISGEEFASKLTITISEIRNDSIIYEKKTSSLHGSVDGAPFSGDDNDGENGMRNMSYVLIGISALALLIFSAFTFFRARKV